MRIVHFSDWHGWTEELPPADLYVCTGDMLPNFRLSTMNADGGEVIWEHNLHLLGVDQPRLPPGDPDKDDPIPAREVALQSRYLDVRGHGYVRKLLANPAATVVCCRGNHDYVDIAPMFAGGPTIEISEDPTRWFLLNVGSAKHLKVGGVRGIVRHWGIWSDEMPEEELGERIRRLPTNLDLLITHSPPYGILDQVPVKKDSWDELASIGSRSVATYVNRLYTGPQLHLFGHAHQSRGTMMRGRTLFSNMSQSWQVIDL